tara:strand:+ start:309292 stop:309825 length:534 start_codon:yes stop_codon:yes gene_type:complete
MASFDEDRHDSFLRVFSEHEAAIRAFVRSLVPTLADANDVMQETSVVLWRRFGEYDFDRDFRGWAFGVAKMQVLSWKRDRARDRHLFGEELSQILAHEAEDRADRIIAQHEALENCLGKLPAKHRQMVTAAYAPGMQINELARSLQQSAAAMYKRIHRIRLALVECTQRELTKEGWS